MENTHTVQLWKWLLNHPAGKCHLGAHGSLDNRHETQVNGQPCSILTDEASKASPVYVKFWRASAAIGRHQGCTNLLKGGDPPRTTSNLRRGLWLLQHHELSNRISVVDRSYLPLACRLVWVFGSVLEWSMGFICSFTWGTSPTNERND